MASRTEHRERAEELLLSSRAYPLTHPARKAYLTEAQLHATLALSADAEVSPATFIFHPDPELSPEAVAALLEEKFPKEDAPTPKVVPGSEEDLIRKEAGK